MVNLLFTFLALPLFAQSNNVGFSQGNVLTAIPIQGQVQVTCSGFNGEANAVYNCRDVVLEPQAYDYFLGPRDPKLRWVDIIATRQDGSNRVKTAAYDGANGRTTEALNLWISTIFQKGLLALGNNEIQYKLYTADNTRDSLVSGTYQAVVNRAPTRQCQAGSYESPDINDCSSQYSICQRFFSERNFCK